jgi:hypothetical protein
MSNTEISKSIKYKRVPFVDGEYIDGLLGENINSIYSNFISDVIGFANKLSKDDFVSLSI